MQILHGTWLPQYKLFALWGEDTAIEPEYRKGRRGHTAPLCYHFTMSYFYTYLELTPRRSAGIRSYENFVGVKVAKLSRLY